jgi:hypothetical protein
MRLSKTRHQFANVWKFSSNMFRSRQKENTQKRCGRREKLDETCARWETYPRNSMVWPAKKTGVSASPARIARIRCITYIHVRQLWSTKSQHVPWRRSELRKLVSSCSTGWRNTLYHTTYLFRDKYCFYIIGYMNCQNKTLSCGKLHWIMELFAGGKSGQGVALNTHHHLALSIKKGYTYTPTPVVCLHSIL